MTTLLTAKLTGDRVFELDVLRAFAILGVVAMHGNELLPEKIRNACTKCLFFFDWVGIFFVLSGFLIGGILIRGLEKDSDTRATLIGFWIRRWLRTLPAYFAVFLLLVAIHIAYNPAFSLASVWQYPLFLQNFASPIPAFFVESWSLSVEEWFYLPVPFLIALLMKFGRLTPRVAIVIVAMVIIVFCNGMRIHRYQELHADADLMTYILNTRLQVVTRLDGIMYGVLGAYWSHYHRADFLRLKKLLLIASLVLWLSTAWLRRFYPENTEIYLGSFYWWVVDFTVVSVATLFCLPFLSEWKSAQGRMAAAVTSISVISYSMYLVNGSLIQGFVLDAWIPWGSIIPNVELRVATRYALYWVLVVTISSILYRFCELPMMRLRENPALIHAIGRLRRAKA